MKKFFAVAMLSVLALTACSDSSGPGENNIAGTYTLRTVNGSNVPFVIAQIGTTYKLEILSGSVVISSNGTYTETASLRETNGTTVTTEQENSNGTWTRVNNAITFRDAVDQTTVTASAGDNSLTLVDTESSITLVYRK